MDQVETIIGHVCSCHFCKNTFTNPVILQCFHSFCSDCLIKYISEQTLHKESPEVICPICSTSTASSDTSSSFLSDSFCANLVMTVKTFRGDKECDICQRRSERHVATCWCLDCYDALCQNCAQVHQFGRTTSSHKMMSLSELQEMSVQSVMRATSFQRCLQHETEAVQFFCLNCGLAACVQCKALKHQKCDRCVPVVEARMLTQGDITEVMSRLQSQITEGRKKQEQPKSALNNLEDNNSQVETKIRSVAEEMRQRITECEKSLINKLHSVSSDLIKKASKAQNGSNVPDTDGGKNLNSAAERMSAIVKYGSDLDVLDIYHKVKGMLTNNEMSNLSNNNPVEFRINFDVDDSVKIFKRDFEKLGDIRVEDCGQDDGLSAWGVAVTSRDEIVVIHRRYKKVQKFTSNGSLIDNIQLNEEPQDITNFFRYDVAITVKKMQILVLSVTGKLDLNKRIETQRQYGGIASLSTSSCFIVSSLDEACIDLITMEGEIIHSFSVDKSNVIPGVVSPKYVAFTQAGHMVISDTMDNSVTCVSQDGLVLFIYSPTDGTQALRKAQGVCCDKDDNVFVADYGNSRIHLLTSDGKFQRFIVGQDNNLRRPVALTMTNDNKLIVVQSDGMVKVFSYEGNQDQGDKLPNGQHRLGRQRLHSSSSPDQPLVRKTGRSFSVSTEPHYGTSTLSPHTFRSRHF